MSLGFNQDDWQKMMTAFVWARDKGFMCSDVAQVAEAALMAELMGHSSATMPPTGSSRTPSGRTKSSAATPSRLRDAVSDAEDDEYDDELEMTCSRKRNASPEEAEQHEDATRVKKRRLKASASTLEEMQKHCVSFIMATW